MNDDLRFIQQLHLHNIVGLMQRQPENIESTDEIGDGAGGVNPYFFRTHFIGC